MSLPGVTTTIRDRFVSLTRTDIPVGTRVLVLGTRDTANGTSDGSNPIQDLDPYNPRNEEKVMNAFGEGSQLHRGYLEALSGGAARVTLVALPYDTEYDHVNGEISSDEYTDFNPDGDLFDDAFSAIEAARPDIVVPWGRGIHSLEYENPATPGNDPELGFHADNSAVTSKSWVKKIADKMSDITINSHPCFAVLGIKPFGALPSSGATPLGSSFESMTPAQVNSHLQLSGLVDRGSTLFGEVGFYVNIVATELKPLGYPAEFGYANGAATYAGAISRLDSWSSPTGKSIFSVESLRYVPTTTTKNTLIDKGIVPVGLDFNRIPTWVDSMTFSRAASDYTRLTTLRIVFDAVLLVRQVSQQFIGEAATLENRNALETAITAGLRGMQQLGALLASDFVVTYDAANSRALIDLVLQPAFELRNIEISVSVQL